MEIMCRKEAKIAGKTIYFTGKPCPNGHNTFRYASNGACSDCIVSQSKHYRARHREERLKKRREDRKRRPEHYAAQKKAYSARNKEAVRSYRLMYYNRNRDQAVEYGKEYRKRVKKTNPAIFLLQNAKSRAKIAGMQFDLKHGDIIIPSHCPVLGIPLAPGTRQSYDHSPSVDRVDSKKGYTKDNIRQLHT